MVDATIMEEENWIIKIIRLIENGPIFGPSCVPIEIARLFSLVRIAQEACLLRAVKVCLLGHYCLFSYAHLYIFLLYIVLFILLSNQ